MLRYKPIFSSVAVTMPFCHETVQGDMIHNARKPPGKEGTAPDGGYSSSISSHQRQWRSRAYSASTCPWKRDGRRGRLALKRKAARWPSTPIINNAVARLCNWVLIHSVSYEKWTSARFLSTFM